ncbi:MAG TPA: hypothetical protein ENI81_01635, partial [Phycisphaerales bacterium]|nr:hypothetical protein [Phycisphaerales bacterium]
MPADLTKKAQKGIIITSLSFGRFWHGGAARHVDRAANMDDLLLDLYAHAAEMLCYEVARGRRIAETGMLRYGRSNLRRDCINGKQSAYCSSPGACRSVSLVLLTIASVAGAQLQRLPRGNFTSGTGIIQSVSSSSRRLSLAVSVPLMGASGTLLQQGGSHLTFSVSGNGQLEVGKPDLPVFGKWVLVPNGTTVSVRVVPGEPTVFERVDVPPVQPPRTDSPGAPYPEFTIDAETYSTDADYPGVLAWAEPIKTVRGQDCTIVRLCPYQYNPVTRRLSVYENLIVDLEFEGDIRPESRHLLSTGFDTVLRRSAINADEILAAQQHTAPKLDAAATLLSVGADITADRIGNGRTGGCDYLIICDPAFLTAAEALVGFKRLIGLRTRCVTTDETGVTASEIESYVDRSQEEWFPAPAYVLLLGDAEYIPCFYELPHASDEGRTDALMQGRIA